MKYDDIIHLPHHVSETHPRMSLYDRAAQFSPFAALTGHGEAIRETARRTQSRVDLSEDGRRVLDEKLGLLMEWLGKGLLPVVRITYFRPDEKKMGGEYVAVEGTVRKVREYERRIALEDGREIPMEEIIEIDWDECGEWED
ncbi:MAG: hypothetical protein HFH62_03835 [Lachnospiraceae bacterium]|nr:hypothetical protein [Lachnospiraceae bacterium]